MHCFTESWEVAQAAIDLGFLHLVLRHRHLQERRGPEGSRAARVRWSACWSRPTRPTSRPVPHRGKTNEPAFVKHVAEEIARLKEVTVDEVARATTANFFALFRHARPRRPDA